MFECHICRLNFASNRSGQFTTHLESHGSSLEDYVIVFQYAGIAPKCVCGLCEDKPVFSRGKFLDYAQFHNRFSVREKLYRERRGTPTCQICSKEIGFFRGEPRKWCSQSCAMSGKGFGDPQVQQKIKDVVLERYGVENVSNLDDVKKRISEKSQGRTFSHSVDSRQRIGLSSRARWANANYKENTSLAIKRGTSSEKEIVRRSLKMKIQMSDSTFCEHMWTSHKNRLTKLHVKIRDILSLKTLGFVSEQRINRYFVDELNEGKKIIIEINGDYAHANPSKFRADDIIRLRGQAYTAAEKWESDALRKQNLENLGYAVITVWESDDLNSKRAELDQYLRHSIHGREHEAQA